MNKQQHSGFGIYSVKTGFLWKRFFKTHWEARADAIETVRESWNRIHTRKMPNIDWDYCYKRKGLRVVEVELVVKPGGGL